MMTGLPPFYSKDTNKMYENILNSELVYPSYLSLESINLISTLLQKNPDKRYQSIGEIKRHSWLKGINWEDLLHKKLPPPIVPNVKECYVDPDYVELPLDFEES